MKYHRSLNLLALLLAVALAPGFVLRAEDNPPAPPPASTETKSADPQATVPEKKSDADQPAVTGKKPDDAAVAPAPAQPAAEEKKPDESATKPDDDDKDTSAIDEKAADGMDKVRKKTDDTTEEVIEKARKKMLKAERRTHEEFKSGHHGSDRDRVQVMNDNYVPADVVVPGNAVAVLGDLAVDGEVDDNAVTVLGDTRINGTVRHNTVTVLGDVTLGPKARVEGDLVVVGGEVHREEGAEVGGHVEINPINVKVASLNNWWVKGIRLGRPLAIGAHLAWLWIATAVLIAFYALLALAFPGTINKCGEKLVQRTGMTILAAVLCMLALPVLFILLCVTVIGIPVALFLLPLGIVMTLLFGKASIYALVGRKISQDRLALPLSVILGALLFVILYLLPVVGLLISFLVSFLGFGCVVLTIFTPNPKPVPIGAIAAPTTAAAAATATPAIAGDQPESVPPPLTPPVVMPAVPPPLISAATLPRAGFWIRLAAVLLDVVLVGMLIGFSEGFFHGFGFHPGEGFPLWFAGYNIIMWALRGTTIGGIICGLKIVRLDDRKLDWGVAIVRALGAFLSMAVAGLGFIWVAFDNEKQSWHDKIAGTTIVKLPKGTPLL